MSRTASRRLLAQSPFAAFSESALAQRLSSRCLRPFSHSSRKHAEGDQSIPPPMLDAEPPQRPAPEQWTSPSLHPKASTTTRRPQAMAALSKLMEANREDRKSRDGRKSGIDIEGISPEGYLIDYKADRHQEPHHMHVYATKHNTHITFTRPDHSPLLSKSCGDLGFKHSHRKHYDSAFQLAAYVFGKLHESGKSREITKLAVIMRGFGAGREAVTKSLLGTEGRYLRGKVVSVSDSTRLKFGGTRSPRPRRLG